MNPEPKSRTRQKKEAVSLQKLGERLAALSSQQIAAMDLPEELREAIRFAKTLTKHGAYRRQMQYIGALMREIDPEPIQKALDIIELGDYQKARAFQRLEALRDELIGGNDSMIDDILAAHPEADRQRLSQLVRSARREKQKNRSKKSFRNLFAYLREIHAP